jgi:hypothetical protein
MTSARDSIRNRQVNNHIRPYKPLTITGVSQTVALSDHRLPSRQERCRLGMHQHTSGPKQNSQLQCAPRYQQCASTQLSLLSYPWAQQVYCVHRMHQQGHPALKETKQGRHSVHKTRTLTSVVLHSVDKDKICALNFWSPRHNLCTTSFKIQKFCVLPTMCCAWISGQTAIISLHSINLFVFTTQAKSVYCAVRTGYLNQTATVSSWKV